MRVDHWMIAKGNLLRRLFETSQATACRQRSRDDLVHVLVVHLTKEERRAERVFVPNLHISRFFDARQH